MNYSRDCTVPSTCITCGNLIGHLYGEYIHLLDKKYKKNPEANTDHASFKDHNNRDIIKALGLEERYCCFQHLMSHPKNMNNNL